MALRFDRVQAKSILTRSSGFLKHVCSHSAQPYRGCSYGRTLCGVGCYVQHNGLLTRGERWGDFLEARENAASLYLASARRERDWARRSRASFSIFMSSSTDPFVPQERRAGITAALLRAMLEDPPDELILQTHSHRVLDVLDLCRDLHRRTRLRVQISIESDRDRLPGLPPPASSVERRFASAEAMRQAGLRVVIAVAPLLPILDPRAFFARIADCADAVILDHFIGGDGSEGGSRTARTRLPDAIRAIDPRALELVYRDEMVAFARLAMPGRVGVHIDGFAGRFS